MEFFFRLRLFENQNLKNYLQKWDSRKKKHFFKSKNGAMVESQVA